MLKRGIWLGLAMMVFLAGSPRTVYAGCFGNLNSCFGHSSQVTNFWNRFFAALDCELDFVECVRIKVVGV